MEFDVERADRSRAEERRELLRSRAVFARRLFVDTSLPEPAAAVVTSENDAPAPERRSSRCRICGVRGHDARDCEGSKRMVADARLLPVRRLDVPKSKRLPRDQENGLILRYRGGEEAAGVALLRTYEGFVYGRVAKLFGAGVEAEDLLQEARLGFLRALQDFEIDGEARLTTHAGYWVRHYAIRHLQDQRDDIRVPTNVQMRAHLSLRDGTDVPGDDLLQKARAVLKAPLRLDAEIRRNGVRNETHGARFADPSPNPEEQYTGAEGEQRAKDLIGRAMTGLSDRERDIVRRRRLVDEPETLEQIGQTYDLTRERVRQIEAEALCKIRRRIELLGERKRRFGILRHD